MRITAQDIGERNGKTVIWLSGYFKNDRSFEFEREFLSRQKAIEWAAQVIALINLKEPEDVPVTDSSS